MTQDVHARMRRSAPILLATCLLLMPVASTAAQGREAAEGSRAGQTFTFPAGSHELSALIRDVGRFLGRNHLLSNSEVMGLKESSINLQQAIETDAAGAEEILSQLTATHGLIMTCLDAERGLYEWLNVGGPRRGEIYSRALSMSVEEVTSRPGLVMPVQLNLRMQHTKPSTAANSLRPLFANTQGFTPIQFTSVSNDIVIIGLARDVAKAARLLQMSDQPPIEPTLSEQQEREKLMGLIHGLTARITALEKSLKPAEKD